MNAGGVDKACKSSGRLCFTMFSTNSLNSKCKTQNAKFKKLIKISAKIFISSNNFDFSKFDF